MNFFNFGITENAASCAGMVNCPNKNIHLCGQLLEEFKCKAPAKAWSMTEGCYSQEAINNMCKFYKCHCVEYPAHHSKGEATFWNGIQLNMNFNASLHTDNSDVPGTPCVVLGLGIMGATLRVYPNKMTNPQLHFDIKLQPGDAALIDSRCSHEILLDTGLSISSGSGRSHMNGRISVVFMANVQKCNFMTCQNLKKEMVKKRLETVGICQTKKRHEE